VHRGVCRRGAVGETFLVAVLICGHRVALHENAHERATSRWLPVLNTVVSVSVLENTRRPGNILCRIAVAPSNNVAPVSPGFDGVRPISSGGSDESMNAVVPGWPGVRGIHASPTSPRWKGSR